MFVGSDSPYVPRPRSNSFDAASTHPGLTAAVFRQIPYAQESIEQAFLAMGHMPLLREHRPDMAAGVNALPRELRAEAISEEIQKRVQPRSEALAAMLPEIRQYRLANLVAAEFEYQFLFEDTVAADTLQHCYLFLNEIDLHSPALAKHFSQVGLFAQAEGGRIVATSFIAYDNLFRHGIHHPPLNGTNPECGLMNYVDFVDLLFYRRDQVALITPGFSIKSHTFESAKTKDAIRERLQKMLENTPTHGLEPVSISIIVARNEPITSPKLASTCVLI